jgi:hypothetical protein
MFYIRNLVCFRTLEGFRTGQVIPLICKILIVKSATFFSFSYDSERPK